MNTWIVGRVPIAHVINKPAQADGAKAARKGEKIFFLKGRIMAGQVDLTDNKLGLTDFKWLTQDELAVELQSTIYHKVKNMLAER